ncbi:MAG: acetate/propionate family kinase [Ruminococcaceae bacterium]|nr:acetate/propionate family kinase [Oscillospiraceae bacterium]
MKKIFIMNLGTTSFKFKLYHVDGENMDVRASGEIESVGAEMSRWQYASADGHSQSGACPIPDHGAGFTLFLDILQRDGLLTGLQDLNAVGYKAVHGGSLSGTRLVDDELIAEMERVTPLAPAHNPIYLSAMKSIRRDYPELTQVARFETSFHATIPDCRTTYGVPYAWREEFGIRKYGFHGSSHEYIARTMKKLQPDARRVITCHLGGSSSICAILDGKSIATTMGATLQSGLFNNNRVGDFEPFCLPMLMEKLNCSMEDVLAILSKQSGLLGLSGVSNDLRLVLEAAEGGNAQAQLAVDTLIDNILGYIGMYIAYLGGLDALVFTGGIGLNSDVVRSRVCEKLAYLGLALDSDANNGRTDGCISTADSKVSVWRLKTDEESIVAQNVCSMLQ